MTSTETDEATAAAVEHDQAEYERERAAQQAADDAEHDGEPEPEPTPEPEPEPEPASDVSAERAIAQIEKAGDAYAKKVQTLSDRAQLGLLECPLCPVPGFVPAMAEGAIQPEQRLMVMSYLGEGLPVEQRQGEQYSECETCAGLGMLATGSRRPGFTEAMCEDCQGNGFIDARHVQAQADVAAQAAGGLPPVGYTPSPIFSPAPPSGQVSQGGYTFTPTPGGSSDPYGRMPGHPLWGQPFDAGGI